jgi:hypothetical protein
MKFLDKEEKEIIESLHSEQWTPNPIKAVNKKYENLANIDIKFNYKIDLHSSEKSIKNEDSK